MKFLDSKSLKLMIESASNQIQNYVEKINDMNVFPVPDGDTGTNMSLTFSAAANSVTRLSDTAKPSEVLECLSKSALRNARGNSGVILSQILRGLYQGIDGVSEIGVSEIKRVLCFARDTAYRAVMKPTEGTILTVVREIAEFAEEHFVEYDDVVAFAEAIEEAGIKSLKNTPEILPVLKQAGVVDAGGCGVMVLIQGAVSSLKTGKIVELINGKKTEDKTQGSNVGVTKSENLETANIKFKYCTEFLINKSSERNSAQFMEAIRPKGDCMLVIDDDEIVKVHIHTNHPGFVLEQAIKLGELTNLKIDNMKYQHEEKIGSEDSSSNKQNSDDKQNPNSNADNTKQAEIMEFAKVSAPKKKYGFVSVVSGEGMKELFKSLDCDKIVSGGQTMNPSTQDLLDAVSSIEAENIFILPNNKNIILAAEQVNNLTEKVVTVIPTKNMPQGITALASFDEEAEPYENIEVMNEELKLVKCGQVTYAARNSRMNGFDIHEGDYMAVVGSEVCIVGMELKKVCLDLCEKLVDNESGVISLYFGEDVKEEDANEIAKLMREKYPDLDVNINFGGQAVYYYIIAVE